MEQIKVIKHTDGDDRCLENVVNYPIGKDQVLKVGFGIDTNNTKNAATQFKKTAGYFNNENKTKAFHYMVSYTTETAPTAEKALELTKEIFKPITDCHLTAIGIHEKDRDGGKYHSHVAVSPTDFRNGSMLYADNRTNFSLAQRVADVTGEPVQLTVRYDVSDSNKAKEWDCKKIFIPLSDDEE